MSVRLADSEAELIARADGIMVMGADDCSRHEELANAALASGKPIYCDKTFAPDYDAAVRMFDRAQAFGTPVFTCSAQRYVMELNALRCLMKGKYAERCETTGPGDFANYSIHQFEMVEYIMGQGAASCTRTLQGSDVRYDFIYQDGRTASIMQGDGLPFSMRVYWGGRWHEVAVTDYYMALMYELCGFFSDKMPRVGRASTFEIMAMQQMAREAR
jgi:hypothetical protein